jgi:SAM-dependent methyltransferase
MVSDPDYDCFAYWNTRAALHAVTPHGREDVEDVTFPSMLVELCGSGIVLDYGCGYGRLSTLFDPQKYIGVDWSPMMIMIAKFHNSDYTYLLDHGQPLPIPNVMFMHTVLLHVPDHKLDALIDRFCAPRVIISEVMDRKYRDGGLNDPPAYDRDESEYVELMQRRGYSLAATHRLPYPYMPETHLTMLVMAK